jgi:hypothetical protein
MGFAISRRTIYVLASVAVATGLLEVLAGPPATSDAVGLANDRPAASQDMVEGNQTVAQPSPSSTLTPAAAKLLFALSHRATDASKGGDLFAPHSWYVAPPPPPPPPPAPPAAPTAPPFPYAFLGSYAEGGNKTTYFLTRNDRVYDVRLGDTLDQIYSVDGVDNGQLVFTYKPLNIRQTLPIGGGP